VQFFLVALAIFIFTVMTWAKGYASAVLVLDIRQDILIVSTVVGSMMLLASVFGFMGALLHRKKLLILFLLFIWPCILVSIVTGFLAYKERNGGTFINRLSDSWDDGSSQPFIQNQFSCCGFLWGLDRPFVSDQCQGAIGTRAVGLVQNLVPRLTKRQLADPTLAPSADQDLPGCIATWGDYISTYLRLTYIVAFACIPLDLFAFIVGILATNHIYH
jgi:hypothetical protein